MRHRFLLTLAVSASLAACDGSQPEVGAELDGIEFGAELVLGQSGVGWPSASQERPHALANLTRSNKPLVLFVDVNKNGRPDTFQEPTARCTAALTGCRLPRERITVHRVVNGVLQLPASSYAVVGDQAVLVFEAFDAQGAPRDDVSVCRRDRPLACAMEGAHPFISPSSRARAIPVCDLDLVQEEDPVVLRLSTRGLETDVQVETPARLDLEVSAREQGEVVQLTARSKQPLTQALAWIGSNQELAWSSELFPDSIRFSEHEVQVSVPSGLVRACASCRAMLQLASLSEQGDVSFYTEERITVEMAQESR